MVYKERELAGKVLEGAEEEAYWVEFTKSKVSRDDRAQNFRRNNRKVGKRGNKGAGDVEAKKAKHTVFKDEEEDGEQEVKKEPVKQEAVKKEGVKQES